MFWKLLLPEDEQSREATDWITTLWPDVTLHFVISPSVCYVRCRDDKIGFGNRTNNSVNSIQIELVWLKFHKIFFDVMRRIILLVGIYQSYLSINRWQIL